MVTLISRVRNLLDRQTPKVVTILLVVAFLAAALLGLVLLKKELYPFSMTWGGYLFRVSDNVSIWTGRAVWVVLILTTILLPLLTGKPISIPDVSAFAQGLLQQVPRTLVRLTVAGPALMLSILLLLFLGVALARVSRPPAPPPAGLVVLPTDPRSPLVYRIAGRSVVVYDRRQGMQAGQILPSTVFPFANAGSLSRIAVTTDEKRLFATDAVHGLVHVLNTGRKDAYEDKPLPVGTTADAMAFSGDGRKLYVAVVGPIPEGRIHVFNVASLKETAVISGVGCPTGLFATARESLLFVATQCGGNNDPLYVFDTRTDRLLKTLPGFAVGTGVVATPDGSRVFVSTTDSLYIVKNYMRERSDTRRIPLPVSAMAISPNGHLLLVGTQGRILSVDVRREEVCHEVQLEAGPTAIAVAPDGAVFALLPERTFVTDSKALECR